MRNEPLLNALEVKIASIPQQLRTMDFISYAKRISSQNMKQVRKDTCRTTSHLRRNNNRSAEERIGSDAWSEFARGSEEDGEAESEVIGFVTWTAEEITRYLELFASYSDVYC